MPVAVSPIPFWKLAVIVLFATGFIIWEGSVIGDKSENLPFVFWILGLQDYGTNQN